MIFSGPAKMNPTYETVEKHPSRTSSSSSPLSSSTLSSSSQNSNIEVSAIIIKLEIPS